VHAVASSLSVSAYRIIRKKAGQKYEANSQNIALWMNKVFFQCVAAYVLNVSMSDPPKLIFQ